jgi:hypothetical protein
VDTFGDRKISSALSLVGKLATKGLLKKYQRNDCGLTPEGYQAATVLMARVLAKSPPKQNFQIQRRRQPYVSFHDGTLRWNFDNWQYSFTGITRGAGALANACLACGRRQPYSSFQEGTFLWLLARSQYGLFAEAA